MKFLRTAQKGKNHLILYLAGLFCVYLGMNIGSLPLYSVLSNAIKNNPDLGSDDVATFNANPNFELFGINANLGFLLLLLSFLVGFIVLYLIFSRLHHRPFKTLITWEKKIDYKRILFGFTLWLIIGLIIECISYFMNPEAISFNFEAKKFIPLLLLSLLILPIQTSLEELIFRSYLFQGIANSSIEFSPRIKILAAWIITSVLFGLIHLSNPEVQKFGTTPMMFYYIGAGLFLGLITIWDDRLELALGVHAATNFIGATIIGYDGAAIQTESLFKTNEMNVINTTIAFYLGAVVFVLICKRKYGWNQFLKIPTDNIKELT